MAGVRLAEYRYISASTPADMQTARDQGQSASDAVAKDLQSYGAQVSSSREQDLYGQVSSSWKAYETVHAQLRSCRSLARPGARS